MKAWITSRRISPGREQEFRHRWAQGKAPAGMVHAYLLEDDQHPGETLTVSLWQDEAQLNAYRTGADAASREYNISGVVDQTLWNRTFNVLHAADLPSGRGRRWLPGAAVVGAAGAGAWVYRSRMEERRRQARLAARVQSRVPSVRPVWLAVPAAVAAAGTGAFFLFKRLRGGKDTETHTRWQETGTTRTSQPAGSAVYTSGSAPAHTQQPATGASAGQRSGSTGQGTRLVRDVMTRNPETINYDADLATAAARMRELNVGVLPVMADGRLAGVITDRDVALAIGGGTQSATRRVQDVMTEAPVTISPQMTVEDAARLMGDRQVRRLPVVDGADLVGIVSLGDLAVEGSESAAAEALEQISEPAEPQR